MTEVTSDVAGGFESLWVEAVGVYLIAAMIANAFRCAISLVDCLAQFGVASASLAEVLAEQVAPPGGQTSSRDGVDLHPFAVLQTAFGHHQVDVGFEAQVTAIGV